GPQRKHRECMPKIVRASLQSQMIYAGCPDQLPLMIEKSDAVVSVLNCVVNLDCKFDGCGRNRGKNLSFIAARRDNLPTKKPPSLSFAPLCFCSPPPPPPPVPALQPPPPPSGGAHPSRPSPPSTQPPRLPTRRIWFIW